MKKKLLIIGLVLAVFGLAGCASSVSSEQEHPQKPKARPKVVDPSIAEINMVKEIFSEPAKADAYEIIAQRRLSPAARIHLIKTVKNDTLAQPDKERVLFTLLRNTPSSAQQTMRKPRSQQKKQK